MTSPNGRIADFGTALILGSSRTPRAAGEALASRVVAATFLTKSSGGASSSSSSPPRLPTRPSQPWSRPAPWCRGGPEKRRGPALAEYADGAFQNLRFLIAARFLELR
jgi:hypothetical protein